jgi:chlorite dismutase
MAQEKLTDLVGWAVMHQYFRIDRTRWRAFDRATRGEAVVEFSRWLGQSSEEEGLQFVPLAGIAKSDFGFMAVHPELARIQRLGQEIAATAFGACLTPVYAFLSMSEVSEYMSTTDDWSRHLVEDEKMDPASAEFAKSLAGFEKRMAAYAEARVHPQLPADMPIVCFYPMSKAREAGRNWYTLPFEERKKLMGGHADTGRRFAGRILQLITSSTGIDDWEWGVTLFARDLKSVRDVVYEMRFDAGSAVYGEFGEFYMALRFRPEELAETLRL